MTDQSSDAFEDRLVGIEAVDGFAFESDGSPIDELAVDAPDSRFDRGASVAEQAALERMWRFGHVIVDEAQDLSPMQWRMIARRTGGGGITIVGDLAQRSIGPPGRWSDHVPDELGTLSTRELTVNYRSPAEINAVAAAVLARLAPDLTAPASIRSVGHGPRARWVDDLARDVPDAVEGMQRHHHHGRLAVITAAEADVVERWRQACPEVTWLDPWQAKGLEFDAVIVVEPAALLERHGGLSLLYVAVTRTTDRLVFVHNRPLPDVFDGLVERDDEADGDA